MGSDMEFGEVRRVVPVNEVGNELVPSAPMQRIQTKHATAIAVQIPRSLAEVEEKVMVEANLLGADAFYAWGENKDRIEGPSKELANVLVRCWGNCALELGEVQETKDAWIFTVSFVDLETGYTLPRQFRQAKGWTVHGKFDQARKDDIRFQIGQSKAIRNVILNAMPGWLIRRAMDKAKGGVREAIEKSVKENGLGKVVEKALAILGKLGADESRVLEAMGRKAPGALTIEDLVILKGNIAALESGADTVDSMFPKPEAAPGRSGAETLETLKSQTTAPVEQPKTPDEPKTIEKPKGIGSADAEPPEGMLLGGDPKPRTRRTHAQ